MHSLLFTYSLGSVATFAFAATAVLAVSDRNLDVFGAFCLGIITAIGGGTVRDLILDVPIFWSINQSYIWIALLGSILTYVSISFFRKSFVYALLLYLDAIGAALFGIVTTRLVWELGFCLPIGPIILGVITAIGGGIIRDVLAGQPNLLMRKDLYAIPVFLGCTIYYCLLVYLPKYQISLGLTCMFFTFLLRASAIYWELTVPKWLKKELKENKKINPY
ncbi:MAG: TRIC cation channel family protein [Legionellaceae bacterium]|nr:TRIC cation channel family protein [Legionellaceae bacterium]